MPAPAAASARPQASFEWHLPSRYSGATDERGRIVETQPDEVRPGPWAVFLRVTGPACSPGASLHWRVVGRRPGSRPQPLGLCRFRLRLSREGVYRVHLGGRTGGGTRLTPITKRVVVRDRLIVSIGDSVAAGEGVPETPSFFGQAIWQSARCHRSSRAGVARAARQIEDDDGYSSVTFVHLACSGASVGEGLLEPYPGAVPPRDEPPLAPQMQVLEEIARRRPVNAVLISIGANDVHFSEIASFCAFVATEDCFARPMPQSYGGDGVHSPRQAVERDLAALPDAYRLLAHRLSGVVPHSRVFISEYFDPTHDERGAGCDGFFGAIGASEVEQARTRILEPLNRAIATAAGTYRWNLVAGVARAFHRHGYCADENAWVSTLTDSLGNLGGIAGRHRGTLHPNRAGQEVIGTLIAAQLERDLFPHRYFPPRPFPETVEKDGGLATGAIVAIALAVLLIGPALAALTTMLAPLALLGFLLWLGRETVTPALVGLLLGGFIVCYRQLALLAVRPLVTLAKTGRPLLLPLLVVVIVGAVHLSLAVQILLTAALLVLAWTLIVRPEAVKSSAGPGPELEVATEIAVHGLASVAVGVLLVVGIKLLGLSNPYFETVGDIASGLLLVAVVLWAAAIALRLFSFATNRLRALIAVALGLALAAVAAGVGIVPGRHVVGDSWPLEAAALALFALLSIAIDAVLGVSAGTEHKPSAGARPTGTKRAAKLGLNAAAAAAVVLAVSTGYGLVAAAKRGAPLNPPEEETAETRVPPPGQTASEDPLELARRYAPVLAFSKAERWAPERVGSYVTDATLSGPPGTPSQVATVADLPRRCPERGQSNCFQLSIECDRGDLPCARAAPRAPGRLYRDGAVYVRTLENGRLSAGEPRDVFTPVGPYRNRLEKLIQYWYFYYYDEWRAPVFAGLLVQRHEADWEAVTLGLDGSGRPLFVADSAHCAGSWRPWHEVEASTRLPGPRTHPLVAVAVGSHANYPDPEEKRSPDWASCSGAPAGVTTAIGYASNIRDRTEFGWLWYPPADGWLPVTPQTPPMSFPGTWGANDRTSLRNFTVTVLSEGGAPKSPPLQGLWQAPVRSIFCGRYEPRKCERDER